MHNLKDYLKPTFIMKFASVATLFMLLLALGISWNFNITHTGWWFFRAFLFVVLALVLLWRHCLHIHEQWLRVLVAVVVVEVLSLFFIGRAVSFFYQGESYNEEFIFHFNLETAKFALSAFTGLATLAAIFLVVAGVLAWLSVWRIQPLKLEKRTLMILPAYLLVLVVDPDLTAWAVSSMREANSEDVQLSNIDWEATGLNRDALYRMTDEITAGKNVVMIYLEGLERMYTDPDIFPGLTPFLTSAAEEGLTFTDMSQTRGTTFTVAGILSSQCGTPLLFPQGPGGNDILKNGFLQEGFCLGDILSTAGYRNVFMGGATTRFAGKGVFLSAHGYEEVLGLEELRPMMEDPNYLNNWGLYDDTLLDLAKDKFDEVAADANRPFNFTVLTVDTHPPAGTVSKSCEPYPRIDNSIFHAIHCTDQQVGDFVEHIKQSPAWDDTIVLLMSDHLHMRNTGMEFYPPDYERKLYVTMLNGDTTGKIEFPGMHMDVAPTLLDLMDVQHQQNFLAGRNLLLPDAPERWVDPSDPGRVAAITYLNTNMLSRIETGLCEASPLYGMANGVLSVAGRELDLSMRGRPLPLEVIGTSNALVTLVSNEGKVGLTFPVDLDSLRYVMFQFRANSLFLVVSAEMARQLDPRAGQFEGLAVVFGNLQDGFTTLASGISLEEDFTVEADCGDLLSQSRALEGQVQVTTLGEICDYRVPAANVWNEEEGTIHLDSVAYANSRFRATFQRNNNDWYTVTALNELPENPPPDSCDAYYGSMEVLIPGMNTEDGPASMILKKVPGITLTFEIDTVSPLPQTN